MSIRERAKSLGHQVIGKLVRRSEYESSRGDRVYFDEAGNEYILRRGVLTIVTAEGGVI